MAIHVNVDNFVRAETDRTFRTSSATPADRIASATTAHRRPSTSRPSSGSTATRCTASRSSTCAPAPRSSCPTPAAGTCRRWSSTTTHFATSILHDAGAHELDEATVGTRFALVAVRTLVDPTDPADVAAVPALQDRMVLRADAAEAFTSREYDVDSLDATREALLALAAGLRGFDRTFGSRDEVDPVRHLIGTAAGWGGLPTTEAAYVGGHPGAGPGDYELTLSDVPVDAFWSVSVYNAEGFFEKNPWDCYSVTATPNADGSVTVRFVTGEPTERNGIPVPAGWNYVVRLYRPRAAFFDGTWTLPDPTPVT